MRAQPYFFEPGDRLMFGGGEYVYLRLDPAGTHIVRRVNSDLEEAFDASKIAEIVSCADFRYDRGFYGAGATVARQRSGVSTLNELTQEECEAILYREEVCAAFIKSGASRSDASIKQFLDTFVSAMAPSKARPSTVTTSRKAPSPRTLRRWLGIYEDGGYAPGSLRYQYRFSGNRDSRLDAQVTALIAEATKSYLTEKRPTVTSVYEELCAACRKLNAQRANHGLEPLPVPSIKALSKRIGTVPQFTRIACRFSLQKAQRKFSLVGEAPSCQRPGERLEADVWSCHLLALMAETGLLQALSPKAIKDLERVRIAVCCLIDKATRCILGLAVGRTASAELALRALNLVTMDKNHIKTEVGALSDWDMMLTPDVIVTDNGAEFANSDWRAGLAAMAIQADTTPAGQPQLRGIIERFFRTVDLKLLPLFTVALSPTSMNGKIMILHAALL